jgi:hypothetical protein
LQTAKGTKFNLFRTIRGQRLRRGGVAEWTVFTKPDPKKGIPSYSVRLIVMRHRRVDAEKAKQTVRRKASKDGKKVNDESVLAAEYLMLLTTMSAEDLPEEEALELYRFRWQVELILKRLKSLLDLDGLRVRKSEALAKVYLFGKLLGAVWVDEIRENLEEQAREKKEKANPKKKAERKGKKETAEKEGELSLWRVWQVIVEKVKSAVAGGARLARLLGEAGVELLERMKVNRPRRPLQSSAARHRAQQLSRLVGASAGPPR